MIYASGLSCEGLSNPLGIDVAQPRFSWILNSSERGQLQSAYQILVASSQENLDANKADKWNSGKVISEQSINVVYKGDALKSGKTYYWKVRVWDKDGEVSPYSKTAIFEMGLLKVEDWKAQWISGGNLLRKEFKLAKDIARARVYVSALGYYELRINGDKVGDHVLDPGRTDYKKRILAGINIDPAGPGWRRIVIKPYILGDLKYVSASVKTMRGLVSSNWEKGIDSLTLNTTLPVNSQAKVSIPKMGLKNIRIRENGKIVWENNLYFKGVKGITNGNENDKYITFDVKSGSYSFKMSGITSNKK